MKASHTLVSLLGIGFVLMSGSAFAAVHVDRSAFGVLPDGRPVEKYTLHNSNGMRVGIITYGGIVQSIEVPDARGVVDDVVLGFDDIQEYLDNGNVYFGAIIGRFGNRIKQGRFELEGKAYQVPVNNGPNSLHGGPEGFNTKLWQAKPIEGKDWKGVSLNYVSVDGEMGFPGTLTTTVRYTLNEQNELQIEYTAHTDKPTVVNLTNHSYFNLAGAGNGTIKDQKITIHASHVTPVDAELIPTGTLAPVADTPMDFLHPTAIGKYLGSKSEQLMFAEPKAGGFDFNWVFDRSGQLDAVAVTAFDPASGRRLEMYTTEPGVQFYTGNFLDGSIKGKQGKVYPHWGAFTLEAQHFPDAPNQPSFPSTRLNPGETYKQTTIYKFSTLKG
ncbi:aldose 1-epimerase [Pseudomonas duriflava]|uniref:Aldose 1-epimerase n=1 Tax=Pseudomonas duriflava TaxID=459528 RepID=A0A562QBQ9_9PSED|nr:aldose epimerase family protein [Pseudomonas duriflava]TWI53466.1 aldose 1-epimerase [Pseudomonas duriflava]